MKSNKTMTLREFLTSGIHMPDVYKWIYDKEQKYIAECDRPSLEHIEKSYSHVYDEILLKPKAKPYKYPIVIRMTKNIFDKDKYVEVCLLNPNYVAPAKGLKPWGCSKGKLPPAGHYNINDNKYSQYFAIGFEPWSKIIDTPIIIEKSVSKVPPHGIVGEILWELTFYGWTEKLNKKHCKEIKKKLTKAKKEVKKGKCIIIPPKNKKGFKVVIPDSVSKDIAEIFKKKSK